MDHRYHAARLAKLLRSCEQRLARRPEKSDKELADQCRRALGAYVRASADAAPQQRGLFDDGDTPPEGLPLSPYVRDQNSIEAAARSRKITRDSVLRVMLEIGPVTDHDLLRAVASRRKCDPQLLANTVRPRRIDLCSHGFATKVRDDNSSGNRRGVWGVTPKGR